nr:hypothetical protein [Streptomyces afghaniensis]
MVYRPSPARAAPAAAMSARLRRSPPTSSTSSGASGRAPSAQPAATRLAATSYDGGSRSGTGVRRAWPCSRVSR